MGLTATIWEWLTSASERSPKKGHPDLYPLDVAKLTKELDLVVQAQRLGNARLPTSDAQGLTGTEAAIVQRVERARQDYVDWSVLRLGVINQDLARRNVTQAVNRAREAHKEFDREASGVLTEQGRILRALGEADRFCRAELERFRAENSLSREPRYPTDTSRFLRYAILLLLIVVEGVLNAGFFAQGVSTGLVGGFAYAGVLAALNVLTAFFFGKHLLRNIFHVNVFRRAGGVIFLLMALALMVAIGLGIAHLRDSLTAEIPDAAKVALESLQTAPLHVHDFFSWALFVISVSFGLGALFDGLYIDDLYPGYGAVAKRSQSASEDYEEELQTLRSDLEERKERQLKTLDEEMRASQSAVAIFESLIADKKAAESRLSNALRDADNSMEALLKKFRTENEMHRGDAQRPAYFDSKPKLKPLPLPNFDARNDEAALAEQKGLVNKLRDELQGLRASIQDSFNQQFDRLKPLDTHFPSRGQH